MLLSQFAIKFLMLLAIFAATILGGLFPVIVKARDRTERFFAMGNDFARGIFLGAGFLHLLPDALEKMAHLTWSVDYPFVLTLCAITVIMLLVLEQGLGKFIQRFETPESHFLPYLLIVILSIHSFIAGAALGLETVFIDFFMIFIAIMSHKSAESFALTISLRNHSFPRKRVFYLFLLFSLVTPLGIILGQTLGHALTTNTGKFMEVIFDSIAAGTFIYIALQDKLSCPHHNHTLSTLTKFTMLVLGFVFMGVIAFWA